VGPAAKSGPGSAPRSLSLGDAIRLAHAHRPEVAQAAVQRSRAELAELRAKLARVQLTVGASFTARYQRLNLNGPDEVCLVTPETCLTEAHPFSATATLTIPLWSGGTVEARLAAARKEKVASESDERATLNDVALEVAQSYWAIRRAELLQGVAQRVLASSRQIEEIAKERFAAGIAAVVDFNRSHVLVLREQQQLNTIESTLLVGRARFLAALGVEGDFVLTDLPGSPDRPFVTLDQAESEGVTARPELSAAAARLAAAMELVTAAKGGYWPQLSVVSEAESHNQRFFLPEQQERLVGSAIVGVQVNWLLFDTLGRWTAVRDAELVRLGAKSGYERSRQRILAELRSGHAVLSQAIERRKLAEATAIAQRENVSLLKKRYQVGSILLIEVLLAQVDLSELEAELVEASIAIAEAEAQLRSALGRPQG